MRWLIWIALAGCTGVATDDDSDDEPTSAERYETDLRALAVPRAAGPGWQAAQDLCADRFAELGFDVERHDYGTGINVIGTLAGSASDGAVLLSAHYDSVPGCSGADDNATGVAGVLEAARLLSGRSWKNDLVVACWDEEEVGLVGSRAWVERASNQSEPILASVSLEMIGFTDDRPDSQEFPTGFDLLFPDAVSQVAANDDRGDFLASIADVGMDPFVDALVEAAPASLPIVRVDLQPAQLLSPLLADLQRSDHAAFWQAGYPSAMLTDTSEFRYSGYHCADGEDSVDRLDLAFAVDVTTAVAGAAEAMLGR